jgi:hypothetical protein
MPRGGALTLSDIRNSTLSINCEPCGRRGTYNVPRLMEWHRLIPENRTSTSCRSLVPS